MTQEVLKATTGDIVHRVIKGSLGAIPFAGGLAAEFFDLVIKPPLSKRLNEWMESVTEGLKGLESNVQGFKLEDLSHNEMFITTVMQATQAATRNHQKEKLEALRNACLNAALPDPPEEDLQMIFLGYIDSFTTWHIRILKLFNDPIEWFKQNGKKFPDFQMGGLESVLTEAYPELRGNRSFYDQVFKDLYERGLINTESLHAMMTGNGLKARRSSDMGKRFICFIMAPFMEKGK